MNPRKVTYSRRSTHAARAAHARGEREFKTYDTSAIRPKQSRKPLIVAAIVAALVIIVAVAIFAISSCSGTSSDHIIDEGEQATVEVPEGSTVNDVAEVLFDAGLVSRTSDFVSAAKTMDAGASLKSGVYTFSGGMSPEELVEAIVAGPTANETSLVVAEGMTIDMISEAVERAYEGSITAQEFREACKASNYEADYPWLEQASDDSLEGFLFPKTYNLLVSATADDVIRQMLDQYAAEVQALDYSYPESQGLSHYQALVLASIVEKEGTSETYDKVAAVFYNRLANQGDPSYGTLGSDATTAYEVSDDLESYDWSTDSPYNTRVTKGLPPTPICSPSLEVLQAVCSPEKDFDEYYFFSFWPNDQGVIEYFFDKTYEEHQATIAQHGNA